MLVAAVCIYPCVPRTTLVKYCQLPSRALHIPSEVSLDGLQPVRCSDSHVTSDHHVVYVARTRICMNEALLFSLSLTNSRRTLFTGSMKMAAHV